MGVDTSGVCTNLFRQAVGVGALELRQSALFEDQRRQRVLGGQLLQHVFGRRRLALGRLAHHRDLQALEQYFLQLLGRTEVEFPAGRVPGTFFQALELLGDLGALHRELLPVDQHAARFHPGQHGDQRNFQLLINFPNPRVLADFRPQLPVQRQADLGVFAGVIRRLRHRHLVETDLLLSLARDLLVGGRLAAEVARGQGIQVVARGGGVVAVGLQHRVVAHAGKRQSGAAQHVQIVLGVLGELRPIRIGQHAGKRIDRFIPIELIVLIGVPDRHIERLAGSTENANPTRSASSGSRLVVSVSNAISSAPSSAATRFFSALRSGDGFHFQRAGLRFAPRLGVGIADLAQPGGEAEALEQFNQPLVVGTAGLEVVDAEIERHILFQRDQFSRQWQLIECVSKIFADLAA